MCEDQNYYPQDRRSLLIVISGPSAVGKDTVIDHMKSRDLPFHFVVTATTRKPRPDERNGADYFFVSHDEFAEICLLYTSPSPRD